MLAFHRSIAALDTGYESVTLAVMPTDLIPIIQRETLDDISR